MGHVCHRCSAQVPPGALYCSECGAPQLQFVASEEVADAVATSSGDGQRRALGIEHRGVIYWKTAIRIALVAALVAGLLSSVLAAASVLWVVVAGVLAMAAYRRRLPYAVLAPRVGARIGALFGLMAAAIAVAGNAVFLVIQRYGLHQGAEIDHQLTTIVTQAAARAGAMDPEAPVAMFTNFWLSPQGRVGLILLTMGFLAALIIVFAIVGGVLGAQIFRTNREAQIL